MGGPVSDIVLVERAARGDGIAFSELVSRHYEGAVNIAFGMLKDRSDAQDVAQDAFARIYTRLDSFKGQSAFRTWFYRILVNMSIDALRKRKRRAGVESSHTATLDLLPSHQQLWPNHDTTNPAHSAERQELAGQLQQAFNGLPEIHQAVLLLREIEGMSYDEIATVLKLNKGTVMSRLFNARKRMQQSLTGNDAQQVPESSQSGTGG